MASSSFAMASIAWSLSRDGRRVIHSSNADPETDDETPIEVVFRHFEGKRVIWLASSSGAYEVFRFGDTDELAEPEAT